MWRLGGFGATPPPKHVLLAFVKHDERYFVMAVILTVYAPEPVIASDVQAFGRPKRLHVTY
jgi:hypothetical protein